MMGRRKESFIMMLVVNEENAKNFSPNDRGGLSFTSAIEELVEATALKIGGFDGDFWLHSTKLVGFQKRGELF